MWPFNSRKQRLEKAIAEAIEETQHLLTSFESNRDRLIKMMGADPYVCGYLFFRVNIIAGGCALRNQLPEDLDTRDISLLAIRTNLGNHIVKDLAIEKRYREDEFFKERFESGRRDAAMITAYASGLADIRNHPEFQSIFEPLRKESSKIDPNNPLFPDLFELIRFSRYLRKHFPENSLS